MLPLGVTSFDPLSRVVDGFCCLRKSVSYVLSGRQCRERSSGCRNPEGRKGCVVFGCRNSEDCLWLQESGGLYLAVSGNGCSRTWL